MKKPRPKSRPRSSNPNPKGGNTAAQLRDDIDSGRTGDKVDWSDPAAAPLGTDDEAAGTPIRPAAAAAARRRERGRPADSTSNRQRPHASWLLVGIVVVLVAAAGGWIVWQYWGAA